MATSITSTPILIEHIFGVCIQAVWTGTPTGTLVLEASTDQERLSDGTGVTNWTAIAGSSVSLTGVAGNQMWNVDLAFYRWVRLVYTASSGSGTLNARIQMKGA